MDKKLFGDSYKSLPIDPSQELPDFELQFLDNIRYKKKLNPPKLQKQEEESEDESDNESDVSEVHNKVEYNENDDKSPSSMSVLKSTLISSVLFLLLSNDMVDKLIRTTGLDGIKILFVKVFIFAILFFIITYKFS